MVRPSKMSGRRDDTPILRPESATTLAGRLAALKPQKKTKHSTNSIPASKLLNSRGGGRQPDGRETVPTTKKSSDIPQMPKAVSAAVASQQLQQQLQLQQQRPIDVINADEYQQTTTASVSFTPMEVEDLRHAFSLFDTAQEGRISCTDFREILEALQEEQRESPSTGEGSRTVAFPHLDKLLLRLSEWFRAGKETEDYLDFDEFLQLMESTSLSHSIATQQEDDDSDANANNHFAHVFSLFDLEQKGYISVQDLERVANELGESDMTREELFEMMERANSQTEGQVTLEEFTAVMTKSLFERYNGLDDEYEAGDDENVDMHSNQRNFMGNAM